MPSRLNALFSLIFFYVTVPIVGILFTVLTLGAGNTLFAIPAAMYVGLSLLIWLRKVEYDGKTLNTIRIEEAPLEISQLLSETTNRGVLINQLIIAAILERRGISQADIYRELSITEGTRPTEEMVRLYTVKLREKGLVRDMAPAVGEGKKRVYILTERGEWCAEAMKKYFPKYYVFFLVKVFLKTRWRKKLPPFEPIKQ